MGEKVVAGAFDLSDRQQVPRASSSSAWRGWGGCWRRRGSTARSNLMGLEIELNLAGADGTAEDDECGGAGADREP